MSASALDQVDASAQDQIDVSATALCDAAASNNIDALRAIFEAGGDMNAGDYDRRTAMHLAASEGKLEAVRFLVEVAGADHSPRDRWLGTPLDDATRHDHFEVIVYLKSNGGEEGNPRAVSPSEQDTDATATNISATALCNAAASNNIDALRAIFEAGGDMNAGDYDRRTAMHLAASEGKLEAVRFLVEVAGADHSPRDRWLGTPLDDATRHDHFEVIVYLKSNGGEEGNPRALSPSPHARRKSNSRSASCGVQ